MLKSVAFAGLALVALFAHQQTNLRSDEQSGAAEPSQPPATYQEARDLARNTPGYKNLQRIGLAFHGYHDIFGRFPPALLYAPDGKIAYSWRVELLPLLKHYVDGVEREALSGKISRDRFNQLIKQCGYDINETWDSDANSEALLHMPDVYRHPSDPATSTKGAYYAITGPGTVFDAGSISRYADIKGWVASTLMIVESRSREPWTKPIDIRYSAEATVPRFGGFAKHGCLSLTCDGGVHFIHDAIPPADLRSLITKDQQDKFVIVGIPFQYND